MKTILAAALPLVAGSTAIAADLTNPSFEGGLTGWTTTGTVAISTAAPAAPTEGANCALLTSANTQAAQLAAFIGCTTAQLKEAAGTDREVRNGAAIKQTFTVRENDTLMFDFAFFNGEIANDLAWPDSAFVVVNGVPELLGTSGNLPHGWTDDQRFSKSQLSAGEITVAFVVCNFNDFAVNSQLKVDNVMVLTSITLNICGPADIGGQGGLPGFDSRLDNNDFIAFIDLFFMADPMADHGQQGGTPGADGQFDNNDFIVFIDEYFQGAVNNPDCVG